MVIVAPIPHGTEAGYRRCRCAPCREAARVARAKRRAGDGPGLRRGQQGHGSGYQTHGCRCDICKEWNTRRCAKSRRMRRYGITEDDYDSLLAYQRANCAVCDAPSADLPTQLHVDHDHQTGAVRGLLCAGCNIGLGFYERKAERFALYLANPPAIAVFLHQ